MEKYNATDTKQSLWYFVAMETNTTVTICIACLKSSTCMVLKCQSRYTKNSGLVIGSYLLSFHSNYIMTILFKLF